MLLADLERVCARYSGFTRSACDTLAHTYYQAVHVFGSVVVTQSDFELRGQSTTRIAELTRDHQPGKSEAAYFRPVRTRRSCGNRDVPFHYL